MHGLCDMLGSLGEMVEDDLHSSYNGAPTDGSAWLNEPRSRWRVSRGASYKSEFRRVLLLSRAAFIAGSGGTNYETGFRLAKSVKPRH